MKLNRLVLFACLTVARTCSVLGASQPQAMDGLFDCTWHQP